MEPRQERGLMLAAVAKITQENGEWLVPSQSKCTRYTVRIQSENPTCTCPDHEATGCKCKHIFAVEFVIQREQDGSTGRAVDRVESVTVSSKRTYAQNWPAYNEAQTNEKRLFQVILRDLCAGIEGQLPGPGPGKGRPRLPLRDAIFATTFKVYSGVSARRFMGDLEDAKEKGHISRVPHFNTVLNYLETPGLGDVLISLVERSALPLRDVETDFAIDSTGFTTSRFVRWFDHKYGAVRHEHDWVKCHVMCGVKTNVVTAVDIRGRSDHDAKFLPPFLKTTAKNFKVSEVSADKAYLSVVNLSTIVGMGATPFIPFKSTTNGIEGGLFAKLYHYFKFNQEEFLAHYHKRSNVESTMSMIKAKFRDGVRGKTDASMRNEVLCKVLCHNICCVIGAIYELGIAPNFKALN